MQAILEDMISPQLLIEDLYPGDLLLSNTVMNCLRLRIYDPRRVHPLESYGSDKGYSGYSMLHSVLGDQEAIDTANVLLLKPLRIFINSLRMMTCVSSLKEEPIVYYYT